MGSRIASIRAALSPTARRDQRNIAALGAHLGVPDEEAAVVYRRSREVGFGAASLERNAKGADAKGAGDPHHPDTVASSDERIA